MLKKLTTIILSLFFLPSFASHPIESKTMSAFTELAAEYEHKLFDYSPELGLFWGKMDVALDRFMDTSLAGYEGWLGQEDDFLIRLARLNPKELEGSPEYLTYLLLKESLEAKKAARICREELWDVNPAFGWHNKMAIIAEKQPVGTAEYRRLALARWQTVDKVVEDQITNLKMGIKLGITAPKPAVERVLTQVRMMLAGPIQNSPFFDFALRDGDEAFKAQVAKLIKTVINPALKTYADYLEEFYLPLARTEIGVSALPAGSACYQAKIQQETTLNLSPKDIHSLGLSLMQKIAEEVADIGLKKYGLSEMRAVFEQANKESLNYFDSEQDILNYNFAALERVKLKVPDWFDIMPKAEASIKPYPAHRAKTGASGEYHPPNEDGSLPGIFYINTDKPSQKSRIDQEATLFHELIPGHHFQIALVYENKALPHLNRYLFNSGFGEGWAFYVERLADEMGLYQDDISRLGLLSNEALRAARLVIDTGIHAFHWSREQALDYLRQHTALSENILEGEIDRYIMLPAQATAYALGKNEILSLRQEAKQALGAQFDIRQFHNEVLKHGMLSLSLLRAQIEDWIANTGTGTGS